jgi:hypothetical protein
MKLVTETALAVAATALAIAAAGSLHAHPVAQTVGAVLAANHAAIGHVPETGAAELYYSYSGSGLTGSRSDRVDLATGAYVESTQSGAISDARGYDGKIPWMRDLSRANTTQEGGDRIQVAVNEAYRFANLWWRSDRAGASITYKGRETIEGHPLDHLAVVPKGGKLFDAWFDVDTHLLVRIAEDREFLHTRIFYADYRRDGGLMLPHTLTFDGGAGKESYETMNLTQFSVGKPRPLGDYSCPMAPPTGGTIDGGAASVTLPFRLLNNHIYVEAMVNGKGPYTFIVDTGGHTLVSPRLVAAVGLKSVGAAATSGAGESTAVSGFAPIDEIALGALRMRDQMGYAMEIYDPSIEGISVDGMVGFELFRRFAVQIDYGSLTITFTDPARFDPSGAGTAIPFKFYDHLPMVEGFIDELPARFDIDTGSRVEVTITGPFVANHQLRTRFSKGVSAVTGWGVGGPSRSYAVRLPSMTIGTVKVVEPVADLSEDRGGSMSDPNYDGNIGSGFLKRFVVTFDYAHQFMYLKPTIPAPVDAGRFDRSGMWINAGPDGYVVTDVATGGPAAQAGVAVGDVIASLDGMRCSPEALSDARAKLRARPDGSKLQLDFIRGTARRTTTLVLRDQV